MSLLCNNDCCRYEHLTTTEQNLLHYQFQDTIPEIQRHLLPGLPLPLHLYHTESKHSTRVCKRFRIYFHTKHKARLKFIIL